MGSIALDEISKAVDRLLREQRQREEEVQRANIVENDRRQELGEALRGPIASRLYHLAGLDEAALRAGHARDLEGLRRYLEQRRPVLQRLGHEAAQRHQRAIELLGPPSLRGPAASSELITLDTATQIFADGFFINTERPSDPSVQTGPNQNLAKGVAGVNSGGTFTAVEALFLYFQFAWTPAAAARLNVAAFVYPNVSYALLLQPECITQSSAAASLDTYLQVSQLGADGRDVTGYGTYDSGLQHSISGAYSLGRAEIGPYNDTSDLFFNQQLPIIAGNPILVTVTVRLNVSAIAGTAQIDFASEDFQINVPSVYLIVF